jgi:hypothetical protein
MADELGWGVLCVSWDPERPAQTVGWLVAELGEGVETPAVLGEWSHYHRNRAITGVVVEEGQARLQVGDFLDNVGFRGSGAEPQDCAICGEPFRASDEGDAEIDYFHLYDGTIVHMACGEGCLPQQLEG